MAKLGDLIVRIGADTRGLNTALGNVKKTMSAATKNIQNLGRNMSMGITAPLALMGAASFKVAADFEQSMAKVKAVSGATGAEFKKLEDNAKALGSTTRFTASEVAALQLEYAKLGFSADEITQVTEATLNLAQATGSDLAQSAEVAGATLRGFGLNASETQRVTDVMAASFSSSALDMASFQNSMKYVAPVAKAAGVSIEETTAMLARMADSGIKGSQAGTSLRMIFQQLAAGGGDVTEKLSALASEGLTLDAAFDEVGRRAQTALLVLGENEAQTKKLTTAFENSTGAAKAMADIMDNTAEGAMKRMNSALEGAQIVIGTALAPLMVKLSQLVAGLANKFSGMSEGGQAVALATAAFAAAIGPMLVILPQLATGIKVVKASMKALNTTMLANPYVLITAAVVALGAAVYALSKRTSAAEKIQARMAGLSEKIEKSFASEAASMEFLRFQYKQAGDDLDKRRVLLGKISEISPQTVKDLDAETTSYDDLSLAVDGYLVKLKNKIAVEMSEKEMTAALQEQIQLEIKRDKLADDRTKLLFEQKQAQDAYNKAVEDGGTWEKQGAVFALNAANDKLKHGRELWSLQHRNNKALEANAQLIEDIANKYQSSTEAIDGNTESVEGNEDGLAKTVSTVSDLTQTLGFLVNKLEETKVDPFRTVGDGVNRATESLGGLFNMLEETKVAFYDVGIQSQSVLEALGGASETFGTIIGTAFSDMITGAKSAKEALLQMAAGVIAAALAASQASIIEAMINSGKFTGPAAPIVIPLLVAGGIAMVSGLFAALPAFAEGGIVSGPTMGLIGEYPGAKTNPEVIAPLDKLRSMLGGQNVTVVGKISGRDILLTSELNAIDRNRVRGF